MKDLNRKDLRVWLDKAIVLARESRGIIEESIRTGFEHALKDDGTFVTDVDTSVETALRVRIMKDFPDHGIVGEEFDDVNPGADLVWTIDPIDGTHSFRHGIPLYGTIIALVRDDIPVVGVIDLPGLDLRCSGALGEGAFCNGKKLKIGDVGERNPVDKEIIAIGERKQFAAAGKEYVFDDLMGTHPSVRTYCDCFGHAMTLLGAAGAMVDFNLRVWDCTASELLVREAGGKYVRVFAGERADKGFRYDVVFGKPGLVDWILEVIG